MKRKARIYDAHGNFLRYAEGNDVVKDGEVLRSDFTMLDGMDSMQRLVVQDSMTPRTPMHAPGYVTDADHGDHSKRFLDQKKKLADAWKDAQTLDATTNAHESQPQSTPKIYSADARDAAYERRNKLLSEGWRT